MKSSLFVSQEDLHPHIRKRMRQRGVTFDEIADALASGAISMDAKPGTFAKMKVFPYNKEWEETFYQEKEVTVFYKFVEDYGLVLLTVIARYGQNFQEGNTP